MILVQPKKLFLVIKEHVIMKIQPHYLVGPKNKRNIHADLPAQGHFVLSNMN